MTNPPVGESHATWRDFRDQMEVTRRWAYFDHAAVSPLPTPTVARMAEFMRDMAENGVTAWPRWQARVERVRAQAAELLHAAPSEVAFLPNTTAGVTLVAEAFAWRPGDNVVIVASDFPSNRFPWENLSRRGVEVRRVAALEGLLEPAELASACDARTRIVAVSWVAFHTGWRNDLAALAEVAHRVGARLFVDAIQGLGVFPIDVAAQGVDFLTADGHKWMLGPEGAGLLYIRQACLDDLAPLNLGWNSVLATGDYSDVPFTLKPTAERYEGGSLNVVGFLSLGASLELLMGSGVDRVAQRLLDVTDDACERLRRLGATIASRREGEHRSGIVAFDLPGQDPQQVKRRAAAAGVALSVRVGRLRISPHVYNDGEDLERLVAVLRG